MSDQIKIEELIRNSANLDELANIAKISKWGAEALLKGDVPITLNDLNKVFETLGIKCIATSRKTITNEVSTEVEQRTFRKYCLYWIGLKKFEVKESTSSQYYYTLIKNVLPFIGDMPCDRLNAKVLQGLIYKLKEDGIKSKSIRDVITLLKQIIRNGQEEGIIPEFIFPRFKYPKDNVCEVKKSAYTKDELAKILKAIYKNIEERSDTRYRDLGILIAIMTGARIGELCASQFKDIDLDNGVIYVRKTLERVATFDNYGNLTGTKIVIQTPKTQHSIRDIPINDDLRETIKTLKVFDDDYVCSGKKKYVEPRSFREYYKKIVKSLGIEPIKFHGLRHSFTSINIENGNDIKTISELLGHSNVEMTLNVYTHSSKETKEKAIGKFALILNGE